jgi:hypothetical protein
MHAAAWAGWDSSGGRQDRVEFGRRVSGDLRDRRQLYQASTSWCSMAARIAATVTAGAARSSTSISPVVADRHSQVAETPDHLSRRYLRRVVETISAVLVNLDGLEQPS